MMLLPFSTFNGLFVCLRKSQFSIMIRKCFVPNCNCGYQTSKESALFKASSHPERLPDCCLRQEGNVRIILCLISYQDPITQERVERCFSTVQNDQCCQQNQYHPFSVGVRNIPRPFSRLDNQTVLFLTLSTVLLYYIT